jgi:hypothetical protein
MQDCSEHFCTTKNPNDRVQEHSFGSYPLIKETILFLFFGGENMYIPKYPDMQLFDQFFLHTLGFQYTTYTTD